jgi:hypothetical protein
LKYKHFFIIGAQRSGTTSLTNILDAHPEIALAKPIIPEPKYFKNIDYTKLDYHQYLKNFNSKSKNIKVLGEKNTSYLDVDICIIKKIKKIIKNFKCIILLRDPVYRAFSHYKFSKKNLFEKLDFENSIKLETYRSKRWKSLIGREVSSNPFSYVERGKYYKYILKWQKLINKKNIIILISENFFQDIKNVQFLYKKLGVNKNFVPEKFKKRFNKTDNKVNKAKNSKTFYALSKKFKKSNTLLKKEFNLDLSKWIT